MRRPSCSAFPKAFTLVEALVSITILAFAASALLLGVGSSLQSTDDALRQTIAAGMAQQLMDEVLGGRYIELEYDFDETTWLEPKDLPLGPDAGEPSREYYDDIDDYNGVRSLPPEDPGGIELGKDDGEGGYRHVNFQAPAGIFKDWRQEIDVYYLDASDLANWSPAGPGSDYRAVEVRIIDAPADRPARELVKLRRVVAYVPPLPPVSPP